MIAAHTNSSQVAESLMFSVFPQSRNKMTRLRLHTCVLLASLSSARHWSEHEGLGRALPFLSHDSVHFVLLCQILLLP